jgi:hypothetical protein
MKRFHRGNLASARRAIKAILRLDITLKHKKDLLNKMIWAITKCPGKYKVRYITKAARTKRSVKDLRHEHVYPRKVLVGKLLKEPSAVNKITKRAIACVVTKREHQRLSRSSGSGWERYKRLNLSVWDQEKERWKLDFRNER